VISVLLRLPLVGFRLEVDVHLEAPAIAVLGPSGAGKTSLLESIAGLRRTAEGRIAIDEEVVLDTAAGLRLPPERRRIGWVPQDALLFPHLDVEGNVRFGERAGGAKGSFREAVEILEIGPLLPRSPATLSGGERQRVALARALTSEPRLLLLDEPLAAVDVELKSRILPYLLRIRDEARIPMLYVTHNAGEAEVLAGEALLLRAGRVEVHGPTSEVVAGRIWPEIDPRARFENIVEGVLGPSEGSSPAELRLVGGLSLAVPAAGESRGRAVFAVAPDDILLSAEPLSRVSARNVLAGRVLSVEAPAADAMVLAEASGVTWRALVTAAAVRELGLVPGSPVWLAIKTQSFKRLH
jgi:molybdate transport system ATP-binding protein